MHDLRVKRLRFSREPDTWLRVLKTRTGVTPNLLCRLGFCLSLEEPAVPQPEQYPEDSEREINRYTLLGEFDVLFTALLRQRLNRDNLSPDQMDEQFRAHMNRGVMLLSGRIRSLSDLAKLLPAVPSLDGGPIQIR
jgi:DNA sulfur modification protein DndE